MLVTAILQWAHVFFGMFWFGTVLYSDFILIPVLTSLPLDTQRAVSGPLGKRTDRFMLVVGAMTILLGFVRGVQGGVLGILSSPYGLTWLAALVIGVGILLWGIFVMQPAIAAANRADADSATFKAAIDRIKRAGGLELLMFLVIFTLMIAMHFGY